MITKEKLKLNESISAPYAVLFLHENKNVLRILDKPYNSSPLENHPVALKDVTYSIVDGVLYITGTRIYSHRFQHVCWDPEFYIKRFIYGIQIERNKQLVKPFEIKEIRIKRLFGLYYKKFMGVEFTEEEMEVMVRWLPTTIEEPFEYAISNFKLDESL